MDSEKDETIDSDNEQVSINQNRKLSETNTGFQNIVKRIQLVSRLSKGQQQQKQQEDCYDEDEKLNFYSKQQLSNKLRTRRRESFQSPTTTNSKASRNIQILREKFGSHFQILKEAFQQNYQVGEIRFARKNYKYEAKPFVVIEPTITSKDLSYIFEEEWELDVPKIITLIISGKNPRTKWKNEKQIKKFQTGIVKAAMSTDIRILTNGINFGVTAHLCSALEKEFKKAQLKKNYFHKISNNIFQLFAISNANDLIYSNKFNSLDNNEKNSGDIIYIENNGYNDGQKFELNPNHSHFLILKNSIKQTEFILKLIEFFTKKEMKKIKIDNDNDNSIHSKSNTGLEIPLVSILVEGDHENVDLMMNLIKKQIPIVVLEGSGGLADIIAFAYNHLRDSFNYDPITNNWDVDYIDDYVKPLLSKKISQQFNDQIGNNLILKTMIQEQVIECIRISKQHDGREYLHIIDMHDRNSTKLENLREFLLNSLLRSRRNVDTLSNEQILKDFDLIIDWNCPNVAQNMLFHLNPSNLSELLRTKFLKILTRNNREEFVEVFLSNGFQIHKFLSPSKLSQLFKMIHNDEFFHTICWENILGKSSSSNQGKFFIENDLNWLLEFGTCLRNFINTNELHRNFLGNYNIDIYSAERKSLTILVIWSLVQNRYELVKSLWKYSDHPIHLALIISMFFERLSWHVLDTNLKTELEQKSQKFSKYANDVLDKCYNENITLAYNVLREKIKDWNYMTAVDIAANARMKKFLAHPCCQKWLTNTFQGNIRLREITFGFFTIPISIKILLCSLFIFPMYIWVRFKNEDFVPKHRQQQQQQQQGNDSKSTTMKSIQNQEESDIYDDIYSNNNSNSNDAKKISDECRISFKKDQNDANVKIHGFINKGFDDSENSTGTSGDFSDYNQRKSNQIQIKRSKNNKNNNNNRMKNYRGEVFVKKQPKLWKMIYLMWTSPISKFYISEFFYILFLIFLSLSSLYPNCGCLWLDILVCLWSFLIAIGYIRNVYILILKYSSSSSLVIYPKIFEILLILSFVLIFSLTRIFKLYFYPIYWQKILLSIVLLYFYYRLISVYLPISPTLGPFLYRLRLMITVDFINYMRITMVILIANSIVIHSLKYPYENLTYETIKNIIHQGIISLFTGPPSGKIGVENDIEKENQFCWKKQQEGNDNFQDMEMKMSIEDDPFIIYVFVFQFFIILKLILVPLLFSIFAVTASKWVSEIDSIWKFQRYQLVIDFSNRLSIPEPLTIFYYFYLIFYYVFYKFFIKKCLNCFKKSSNENQQMNQLSTVSMEPDQSNFENRISIEDCLYWKQLTEEYLEMEQRKSEESHLIYKGYELVRDAVEEIEYEKRVLREIKTKMFELEKFIQTKIINNINNNNIDGNMNKSTDDINQIDEQRKQRQRLSRLSPYPGTNHQIIRFPLATKMISWSIDHFSYDPICYTKPRERFPIDQQKFIDDDIIKIKQEMIKGLSTIHKLTSLASFKWNDKQKDHRNEGLIIDRRSWHHLEYTNDGFNKRLKYQLEDNFLPINPFGRTGLRGKGHLPRWGPNHYCILIVAQILSSPSNKMDRKVRILLEKSKNYETNTSNSNFIIENNDNNINYGLHLIERYVNNYEEIYEIFRMFLQISTPTSTSSSDGNKISIENDHELEENIRKLLFQQQQGEQYKFQNKFKLIQTGYLDDPYNTDNAWKEANIFLVLGDELLSSTPSSSSSSSASILSLFNFPIQNDHNGRNAEDDDNNKKEINSSPMMVTRERATSTTIAENNGTNLQKQNKDNTTTTSTTTTTTMVWSDPIENLNQINKSKLLSSLSMVDVHLLKLVWDHFNL